MTDHDHVTAARWVAEQVRRHRNAAEKQRVWARLHRMWQRELGEARDERKAS